MRARLDLLLDFVLERHNVAIFTLDCLWLWLGWLFIDRSELGGVFTLGLLLLLGDGRLRDQRLQDIG